MPSARHDAAGRDSAQAPRSDSPLVPTLTPPKGGGAIRGIGETFAVSPATGTATVKIPLPVSPGRGSFTPQLALSYDAGAGNGPFGIGWHLNAPAISRKTDKGVPVYRDAEDSDTFLLAGAEDLVPALRSSADGVWQRDEQPRELGGDVYTVRRFRPRVEGTFVRIERWTRTRDGDVFWRTISRDNQTSIFGRSPTHRIVEPGSDPRVFSWLIEESFDDRGNVIRYEYIPEDLTGVAEVESAPIYERHRLDGGHPPAQHYLKRVLYGNRAPGAREGWLFQVVFDYGDHDANAPTPDDRLPWPRRADPFSSCRTGFELRSYRLCRRVLIFHSFPELGEHPVLVRSLAFGYDERPAFSLLTSITQTGFRPGAAPVSLPPLELGYTEPQFDQRVLTADAASLEYLPIGLDGSRYQWVDLDGEGVAGVLTEQAGAWWYARNRGGGRLGPVELVATQPAAVGGSEGRPQLVDLGGDGRACLVQYDAPLPGYYERTPTGGWEPFQPFRRRPSISWDDADLRLVDVTGDGLADAVITRDDALVVYPSRGRDGFAEPIVVPKPADDERGPAVMFADREQTIFLADMNGDGLADIVRIRNGEVCYWPSLGHGRFGAKVTMAGSPWFDHPDQFHAGRVRLADVDGAGTTDIIYLGRGTVRFWINQAGNGWGEARALAQFPVVDNLAHVQALDLLGTGLACLVWSSPLPGAAGRQMRYVDLLGGRKPYLLRTIRNNLGAETEVVSVPSTVFSLADRAAGTPWVTRLPFPVHVVERAITRDLIAGSTFTTRYRYRHGYYDRAEREFRGFGMVEQWDTAEYAPYRGAGVFDSPLDRDLDQPPVRTRTWFHTGAFEDGPTLDARFAEEYYDRAATGLPPTVLPAGLSAVEAREAARALKGLPLRSEVYADDGTAEAARPYQVETHAYALKLLQPRAGERPAVFFPHPREAITYHVERDPADPRVAHAFTLAMDDYGTVTRSAAVAYGRRSPEALDEQRLRHVTCTEVDLVRAFDAADAFRAPLPWQTRNYEITGLPDAGGRLTWATVEEATRRAIPLGYEEAPGGGVQKRLIERERQRYYRDDLPGIRATSLDRLEEYALPFGESGARALPYERYTQAFTPGLLRRLYDGRVDDELLREGGYLRFDGGWWVPSGRQLPDPGAFFLPFAAVDPFGNRSTIAYDPYGLLVCQTSDPRGNTTRAEHDYRVLQPRLVTDPNGNEAAATFDALGMVVATALRGKDGDRSGDVLDGIAADLAPEVLDRFLADPDAAAAGLLGRATTRIVYDPGRWRRTGQPVFAATIRREQHVRDVRRGTETPVQLSVAYSDGLGRTLQTKAQAEPGHAPARGPDGRRLAGRTVPVECRWVGSGRVVYNNKGNPVKQYEPFFSDRAVYETEAELVETGVTPVLRYDPLGRVLRTDLPDGTFTRVTFNPWEQQIQDQNDTVRESRWYRERGSPDPAGDDPGDPTARAAWLAAHHAGTPAVARLDSLGRTFLTVADNGPGGQYETRVVLDIEGNQREVIDPRGVRVVWQDFDMVGHALHSISADAGESWALPDISGQPLREWDSRGHTVRTIYDALRRPTHRYVSKAVAAAPDDDSYPERLAERTLYGDSDGSGWTLAQSQAANLRGRVYRHYDGAGVATSEAYDFKGNLLRSARRLTRDPHGPADWSALGTETDIAGLEAAAEPSLEGETFRASTAYDALNRPVSLVTPHTDTIPLNEVRPTYNEAGLLERVDVRLRDAAAWTAFVTDIDYDAKGQRTRIAYGNGVQTLYTYDPLTFRLTMLRTVRPARAEPAPRNLQWLRYTYDPAGNITAIRDDAQQTVYFNNSRVTPSCTYVYDALYRLVRAEGREHAGQNNSQRDETDFEPLVGIPHPNDSEAMQRYVEEYVYDAVGNILSMRHSGGGAPRWTRTYTYAADSNRLLRTSRPDGRDPGDYRYDAHGNMVQMPHLPVMTWDHKDQLRMTQRQVSAGDAERTYYVYDAGGERVRKVTDRASGTRRAERVYLGGYELYRKYAGDGTTVTLARETLHVMDGHRRIALVETQTLDAEHPASPPQPLTRYQLDNHLGSACLEVDEHADVISYEEYHPYGTSACRAVRAGVEVSPTRYRYTGKEREEATGLNYHSARYYAPWLGRWTRPDPAGILDGANLYCYVSGNPIEAADPSGRQGVLPAWLMSPHRSSIVCAPPECTPIEGPSPSIMESYHGVSDPSLHTMYGPQPAPQTDAAPYHDPVQTARDRDFELAGRIHVVGLGPDPRIAYERVRRDLSKLATSPLSGIAYLVARQYTSDPEALSAWISIGNAAWTFVGIGAQGQTTRYANVNMPSTVSSPAVTAPQTEVTLYRVQPRPNNQAGMQSDVVTGGAFRYRREQGRNLVQANHERIRLGREVGSANPVRRRNALREAQAHRRNSPFISTTSSFSGATINAIDLARNPRLRGVPVELLRIRGPRSAAFDFERSFLELGGRLRRHQDAEMQEFGIRDLFVPPTGTSRSGFHILGRTLEWGR